MTFCRTALIKEANNKDHDFQNAVQSLDLILLKLPNTPVKPTDNVAQINSKLASQRVSRAGRPTSILLKLNVILLLIKFHCGVYFISQKVVEDLRKKSSDLSRVKALSRDLQSVLNVRVFF